MDERLRILARSAALGDFDARSQLLHYLDSIVDILSSTRYTEWGSFSTAQRELNALSEFAVNFAADKVESEYYPDKIAVLFSLVHFTASETYPDTMRPDRIYFIIGRFRELPKNNPQKYYFVRVKFGQWRDVNVQLLAQPAMRCNPLPPNYVPVNLEGDLYTAEALDAIDDAIIDLLNASQALIDQRPLYVGKYLMDAAYRLNRYQELAGNDPLILELSIKLRDLALYEGYQDFASIRDRFLDIVESLRPWVLQQTYFRRLLKPERKLDKIVRFLAGQMTEQDKTTSDLVQKIHRILKKGGRKEES